MANYGTVDRCTGGTPGCDTNAPGCTPDLAFDGNPATYWQGGNWINYDFGAAVAWKISKITIQNYGVNAGINGFTVHGSNNDIDYDLLETDNCANNDSVQTFEFDTDNTTEYRYIKITQTSIHVILAIANIEMFESIYRVGGFSGFSPWIFMKDMWEKHNRIWKPKGKILIPQGI